MSDAFLLLGVFALAMVALNIIFWLHERRERRSSVGHIPPRPLPPRASEGYQPIAGPEDPAPPPRKM